MCFVQIIATVDGIVHRDGLDLLIIDCAVDCIILLFISNYTGDGHSSDPRLSALIALLAIVFRLNRFIDRMV